VIASIWRTHYQMFHHIKRGDARLVTLNIALLLVIAFMPFPVELVGRYGGERSSLITYAASMALAAAALAAVWLHATHGYRLVDAELQPATIRSLGLRIETVALLFAVSIPIALLPFGPQVAPWFWVGIFVVRRILMHRYG